MIQMKRSVVILRWNPAFSSFGTMSMSRSLEGMNAHPRGHLDWSVHDYLHVHKGDECFLLKVGDGPVGVCLSGRALNEPYENDDWSGRGRPTRYVDVRPKVCINPMCLPILTAAELEDAIPDFNWRTGHSGELLSPAQSRIFRRLWKAFLAANAETFSRFAYNRNAGEWNFFDSGKWQDMIASLVVRQHA